MRIEGLILSPSRHSTTLSKLPSTCDLNATYPLSSTISVQAASARPRERKLLSHPPQFCSDLVTWQRTCCLAWDDPVGAAPTYQTDNNAFKPQFKLYKYRAGGWRGQRDGSLALNGLWSPCLLSISDPLQLRNIPYGQSSAKLTGIRSSRSSRVSWS